MFLLWAKLANLHATARYRHVRSFFYLFRFGRLGGERGKEGKDFLFSISSSGVFLSSSTGHASWNISGIVSGKRG